MISEQDPDSPAPPTAQPAEIEPIAPAKAAAILEGVLAPYLADGWHVLHRDAYSARLTRGDRNLDLRVDLLGHIEQQESALTPLQDSGRWIAWVVLLAMLLVVMALASALGIL